MNYKKLCFGLRNKLIEKLINKEDIYSYEKDIYQEILFVLLKQEGENVESNCDYEKMWFLVRKYLMDILNKYNYEKDIYLKVLFEMINSEHAEKGLVSEVLETEK